MLEQITEYLKAAVVAALSSPIEIAALIAVALAAGLTVTSSFVKTMVPLRWLAVGSNCGFLAFGALQARRSWRSCTRSCCRSTSPGCARCAA
jgi:hypothetical protein